MRDGDGVRVDASVGVGGSPPGGRAPFERLGVVELEAVEPVLVDVDHDRVAVLDKRDGPAEEALRANVADDEPDGSPGEARIGHEGDRDVLLAAQGRDLRRRIQHFGHSRGTPGALIADDHHVVVAEVAGPFVERTDQRLFAVEDPGVAREDAAGHPALDTGQLQDRAAAGSEIALEQAQAAGVLERLGHRVDHPVIRKRRSEPADLLSERLTRAGERVCIEIAVGQQLADHRGHSARGLDVHHRVRPKRPHVDEHGQTPRQRVELGLGHHFIPEVDPGRPGDLDAVQHDVGRAAHGHGDGQGVAQRSWRHDVPGPDAARCHRDKTVDELAGKLRCPAGVLRGRGDHVQRLQAQHRNERLHGVVREHAPAAALARTGIQGKPGTNLFVGIGGCLKRGDDVDRGTCRRINARPDRAVRHDHRGRVVFQERGNGAHRGLVTRDDGDQARHPVCGQVHGSCVVHQLPADEREAHLGGAVELAVRDTEGEAWRDQAHREVLAGDAVRQCGLNGRHLRLDTQIALAVTEVPEHGPYGVMDLPDVLAQELGRADLLDVTAGVVRTLVSDIVRAGPVG